MANYYVKRTDHDGTNVLYVASDGLSWVSDSGSAFVTTTQAVATGMAAALNLLMLEISSFYTNPPQAPYLITAVTF